MGDVVKTYGDEQIVGLLRDLPEAEAYPRLASDMADCLRGVPTHVVRPETVTILLRALLTSVDPQRAMNHLLRYLEGMDNAESLWRSFQKHASAIAYIVTIFAASQFLSGILCRRPSLLFWLLDGALVSPSLSPEELEADLTHLLRDVGTAAEATTRLRAFTHQHLLRIGGRDLNDLAEVEDITADLSTLAECVLRAGLHMCQRWMEAAHGSPVYTDDTGQSHPCHFCVIGMGKLGGHELNFSSDIDLMYVYTSYQGETEGITVDGRRQNQLSNHEYFVTLARRLTNLLGGKGPEGQAFRVDLRLRPEGTQGQLALSLLSYEAYYARLGQTWERMALLKARPVAGNHELGEEFLALIQPFVYQRHLDPEGIRQLQSMKLQIDDQIADRDQSRTNVKLGLGGIREIEFFIQLLQLVFGGRQPDLQERQSLRALSKLCRANLITSGDAAILRQTYCYLRRLEHRLQMEQGAQTHTLPRNHEQQARFARLCGHTSWESFYQEYLDRTEAVHARFTKAFHTNNPALPTSLSSESDNHGETEGSQGGGPGGQEA